MAKINKKQLASEIQAEKSRIAIENMGFKDNAPPLISIVGPSQSGKSTLLKSIVKKLWRKEKEFKGIVTLKIGRKRYSFYESISTIEDSIDTLKVSDLIIFVINLEVGIQKDTLETLTMMNSIGVPKFMFALTHYDKKASNKQIDEVTKRLQKEFSFPIKYFCFELKGKEYNNIDKIVRQIEAMKYRPVEWKCTHPYIVVDSYTDGYAYGFLRGGAIGTELNAHVPGIGDFKITEIEVLKDPCPLESKGNVFYNRADYLEDEKSESTSAEILDLDDQEIRMFEDDASFEKSSDVNDCTESETVNESDKKIENKENLYSENDMTESSYSNDSEVDLETLKEMARSKFLQKAETEDELIDKFNDEFKTKETDDLNILETLKKKEMKVTEEIQNLDGLAIPGHYIRVKIDLSNNFDFSKLYIIGALLPSENIPVCLKGQVYKNKWQKNDLKSNDPYLLSIGWLRIQTIPILTANDVLITKCKVTSDILFYSPSVPSGTSFFIFDPKANYRIFGSGKILDSSGNCDVKRRIKLIGYPQSIVGQNAIVQSMFSSQREAEKFLNAKVETVSGLRGLIKTAVGKDGCIRVAFEGTILMSDIVILKCFIPIKPIKYYQHLTPKAKLVQPQITECDEESEASEVNEEYEDEFLKARNSQNARKIKELEKQLPYSLRQVKEIKETIDLPVPPEQRRIEEFKAKLETKKREKELKEEISRKNRLEKLKMKRKSELQEKEEYKKKSAIKSHLEKKKHKKSKKK